MPRYLKNLSLLLAGVILAGGSAFAGDNAATENHKNDADSLARDWSGFYAGINGGLSDAHKDLPAFDAGSVTSQDSKEKDIGGQAGYNLQRNHIVIGIEGEVDKAIIITKSK